MVLSCPQEYYDSVLCPLLGPMFAYMLQVRSSLSFNLSAIYRLTFVNVVTKFHGLPLFSFAETECEVADHQPEDIC